MVTVVGALRIDTPGLDAAMAGNLRICGMPNVASVVEGFTPGPINYHMFDMGPGHSSVWAKIAGATTAGLYATGNNVAEKLLTVAQIPAAQPVILAFSMTYLAKSTSWGDVL